VGLIFELPSPDLEALNREEVSMKPEEGYHLTIPKSVAWAIFFIFLLLIGVGITFYLVNRGKSVYFEVDETGRIRKVRA